MNEIIRYLNEMGKTQMVNEIIIMQRTLDEVSKDRNNLTSFKDAVVSILTSKDTRDRILFKISDEVKKRNYF
jgi:hypothetical protein